MKTFILVMSVCPVIIGSMIGCKTMADDSTQSAVEAVLNGLEISIDGNTGSILSLNYPGPGKMLQAEPAEAALIDLAYPIKTFEPLRLATRFSETQVHCNSRGQSR